MKILMAPAAAGAGDGTVVVVAHDEEEEENVDTSSTAPSSSLLSPVSSCSSSDSSSCSAFMAVAGKALKPPGGPPSEPQLATPEVASDNNSGAEAPLSPTPSKVSENDEAEEEAEEVTASPSQPAPRPAVAPPPRAKRRSPPRPPKLSVTFNTTTPVVIHVPARNDICPVTKSSVWYDQRELKYIIKSACADIRRMQDNQQNYQQHMQQHRLLQDPQHRRPPPDCVRGLESFQSPEARDHRRKLQRSNTTAVLAEQHRQRSKSGFVYDEQKIAMVAAYSSMWSKEAARKLALLDECGRDQLAGVVDEYRREQRLERTRTNASAANKKDTNATTRTTGDSSDEGSLMEDFWCGSLLLSLCRGEVPCLSFMSPTVEEERGKRPEQVPAVATAASPRRSQCAPSSQAAATAAGGTTSLKYHHIRHVRKRR